MKNYFNYFTEIEERFQQRRGSSLMLSTLDWALIETWREAGVPLQVVLGGIDEAFDRYDARAAKMGPRARKVNGLAWCAQSVLEAMEAAEEATVGAGTPPPRSDTGFEAERVAAYLEGRATELEAAELGPPAAVVVHETAVRLRGMAGDVRAQPGTSLEEMDRALTALEERVLAAVMTAASEEELLGLKQAAARELAPYRGKMGAVQMRQVEAQFLQKRLLEARGLPRLSLFYMGHG